ncbi:hypothetical protein D3C85_1456380 [compost metagenome]
MTRILTLSGGNPDQLSALEGEACSHEHAEEGEESTVERSISNGKVLESNGLAADNPDDHQYTDRKENNNDSNFDDGEPVFGLPIAFDRKDVQCKYYRQEQQAPPERVTVREPVFDN